MVNRTAQVLRPI